MGLAGAGGTRRGRRKGETGVVCRVPPRNGRRRAPVQSPKRVSKRVGWCLSYWSENIGIFLDSDLSQNASYAKHTIPTHRAIFGIAGPSGETDAGRLVFSYARNTEGFREPERKGFLTPVGIYLSWGGSKRPKTRTRQ